jgi:hypothetical protein
MVPACAESPWPIIAPTIIPTRRLAIPDVRKPPKIALIKSPTFAASLFAAHANVRGRAGRERGGAERRFAARMRDKGGESLIKLLGESEANSLKLN